MEAVQKHEGRTPGAPRRIEELSISADSDAGRLTAQETFPAIHRTALRRLERHGGIPAALGTGGHGFGFSETASCAPLPFGLAGFTALWFVLEILVVEEVLFSRCEYKICPAVYALEDAVLKFRHINVAP